MTCDLGIFKQVFNGTEKWLKLNHFSSAKVCKTNAIILLSRFWNHKPPSTFTSGEFPQDLRNVPTLYAGEHRSWGGGGITNSLPNHLLYNSSFPAKFIWVWFGCFLFLSICKFYKSNVIFWQPDSILIVFKTGCERYDSIWQVIRHVLGSDSLIVWHFTVEMAWKITPISVKNTCHEISVALYWRVQI